MESQLLSINELKDAFFSLKINKSPGHNGVSFNGIKIVLVSYVDLLSIYLTIYSKLTRKTPERSHWRHQNNANGVVLMFFLLTLNLSIVKGIFPDDPKIVKVTPIYKADNSSNVGNYRPISVLPCFSKML